MVRYSYWNDISTFWRKLNNISNACHGHTDFPRKKVIDKKEKHNYVGIGTIICITIFVVIGLTLGLALQKSDHGE